jgi:hypothetical protein
LEQEEHLEQQSSFANADIEDIQIFNRALSPEEIQSLYNSYNPKVNAGSLQKGLVLDLPLTSTYMKSSTKVTDKTPYSNDGTVNGAIVGSEYTSFDGNDYVNCGNHSSINPTIAETISLWVNLNQIPSAQTSNYPQMIGKRDVDTQRAYFLAFEKGSNKIYGK